MSSDSGSTSNRVGATVCGAAVIVALAVWLAWPASSPREAESSPRARAEGSASEAREAQPRPTLSGGSVAPAKTIVVFADDLPERGDFLLELELAVPSRTGEPLVGRVISSDSREYALSATIRGEDRLRASVAIPTEFLAAPDRYIVEIKTTEQSHFPIRRYVILVE